MHKMWCKNKKSWCATHLENKLYQLYNTTQTTGIHMHIIVFPNDNGINQIYCLYKMIVVHNWVVWSTNVVTNIYKPWYYYFLTTFLTGLCNQNDCCSWDGISCDAFRDHVVWLSFTWSRSVWFHPFVSFKPDLSRGFSKLGHELSASRTLCGHQ